MSVLFLDDDPERRRRFRSLVPSADFATTAAECIAALQKNAYGIVCLDHDLGGLTYVDESDENTGSEVVRWIVEHQPKVEQFIVHSYNYDAAASMVDQLERSGYAVMAIPFHAMMSSLTFNEHPEEPQP